MWGGYAHGEWYLRENSRPPCRQQVRSRSDLLNFDCASGRKKSSGHARILATLLRGSVGARLHSAGNADRSLSLVMVVHTGGVTLTLSGPNPFRARSLTDDRHARFHAPFRLHRTRRSDRMHAFGGSESFAARG
jgi:hypothetical protein